jgi:hypothetical protein
VSGGDCNGALKVASEHLGPLAASNQALIKPLKETLVALLQPSEDAFTKAVSFPVLATSLQVFNTSVNSFDCYCLVCLRLHIYLYTTISTEDGHPE